MDKVYVVIEKYIEQDCANKCLRHETMEFKGAYDLEKAAVDEINKYIVNERNRSCCIGFYKIKDGGVTADDLTEDNPYIWWDDGKGSYSCMFIKPFQLNGKFLNIRIG